MDKSIKVTGSVANPTGTDNVWRRYFGSSHAAGLNAVYGDGSVRFSGFSVDPLVWMYSNVIDDGQVISVAE
jgi:hypothetical protein